MESLFQDMPLLWALCNSRTVETMILMHGNTILRQPVPCALGPHLKGGLSQAHLMSRWALQL